MLLENKYFKVESGRTADGTAHFHVRLLPDCDVYHGHFPGNPVSPGVCNIEMIRECFCLSIGAEPRIKTIDRSRLTAIASPTASPEMDVDMSWTKDDRGWHLLATLKDDRQQYMDFKGTLL